ncbi:MAG: biosynthetic peptidoglycan transglycosylase [Myxococcota bacterium]
MTPLENPRTRRRPWAYVAGGLVALVACAALAAAIAVFIGRGKLQSKLAAMGDRFGLHIEVGSVDLPLVGNIGARDVRVYGQGGVMVAKIDRIATDLTLIDAALGASRPGRIELHGGEVRARIVDGRPVDLMPRAAEPAAPSSGPSEPLSLGMSDVRIVVEARQATPWGEVAAAPIDLRVSEIEVARDAERQLALAVRGAWQLGAQAVPFTAQLDTKTRLVRANVDGDAHLGLATPWGAVWIGVGSIERDAQHQRTTVTGLDVTRGDDRLGASAIVVDGGGDGWLPDPHGLVAATIDGLDVHRGDRTFAALKMVVGLGREEGFDLPSPTSLALTDARGESPDPLTGGALRAAADEVALGFAGLRKNLAAGTPLDALTAIRLVRPKATLVITRAPDSDAPAPADGAPPSEADPDPTALLMGNDEDPPASAVAAQQTEARAGFAILDRLFGDPKDADLATGGPSLGDFLPAALRERAAELVPKLRALRPQVKDASLEVMDTQGKTLMALEGASFEAAPSDDGLLAVALRASVLRAGKETGRADVTVALDDAAAIQWVEGTLAGTDLANRLGRFVPGLTVQPDAELDMNIRYDRPRTPGAPHHIAGTVRVANFTFQYWRISDREVKDLQGAATFDLIVDRKGRRLVLNLPELKMGDATFSASLDLTKPPKKLPSFTTRLSMAKQDCGKAFASIPKALIPDLSTLETAGEMSFDASLALDLEKPMDLVLSVTGEIAKCRILSLGPGIDLEALRGDFVHHPREPGRGVLDHIAVGRGTPQWIPSERLPDIVKLAAWVTEDRAWTLHAGVRWELVARALKIDLANGRFVYGGSTITQQLVKNLYLTRTKHLARKLEEAIIAVQMERVLTKDEILTIYINCIEYGPDIYGVKHAARFYFDKKVDELDALEAAFIMGLKPFPKAGYTQWTKGRLDEYWVKRIGHVMDLMARFGPQYITPEEATAFAPYQPKFRPP